MPCTLPPPLSLSPSLGSALTNSRPSRWPHSKCPTSLAGNRNVFVCARRNFICAFNPDPNQEHPTNFDLWQSSSFDYCHWTHWSWSGLGRQSTLGQANPCRNPSAELRQWAGHFVLLCSRLCVKHFHFHFPFKFNANLLAGQAAFRRTRSSSRSKFWLAMASFIMGPKDRNRFAACLN